VSAGDTVNVVATTDLVRGARSTRSTIALKITMAVSGLIFVLWVLAHMYGNLKAFAGHDAFDEYAAHLRTMGQPILPHAGALWIIRCILIVAIVAHVASAVVLWRRARRARTTRYQVKRNRHSSLSSRTMRWGGICLLLFIVWHLINFTAPRVNVTGGSTADPYNLTVDSFDTWWLTLIYLAAMLALGMHIRHGVWSACQTLGWTSTTGARHRAKQLGIVLAVVIAGGFSLVPIFVLAGVITK
jgi:succinate dehydrogenase / fumarate reductase cytochrome b subunit